MHTEVVIGPPGTGKTTTLLEEVDAELARGVPPDRIGFVTFTRRGAEEAVTRACKKFNLDRKALPWFRTLHSICYQQLGLSRDDVFTGKRLEDFADYAGVRVTSQWMDANLREGATAGDRAMFLENSARVRCTTLREAYDVDDDGLPWHTVEALAKALEKFKRDRALLDYTDMLSEFVRTGLGVGLEVLFVDESQDNSMLQWEVVRVLGGGCRRVVVAGDDDQAIYDWAGAAPTELIRMAEIGAKVLDQSWRVPRAVQGVALDVITPVEVRVDKSWAPRDAEGSVDFQPDVSFVDTSLGWSDHVQPVLVLARNEFVINNFVVPELRRVGALYSRSHDGPAVPPSMVHAIRTWESLRRGQRVSGAAARRVYEQMSSGKQVRRGFKELKHLSDGDDVSIEELEVKGGLLTRSPWFEALDRLPQDDVTYVREALAAGEDLDGRPRVRVSTIHASKGGEAHHVVVLKEMARRSYDRMLVDPDPERRVWYVAATRAKSKLTLVDSLTRRGCPWL